MQVSSAAARAATDRRSLRPACLGTFSMSITSSLRHSLVALVALTAFHAAGAIAADTSQGFWQNTQAQPLPAGAPEVSVYRPLKLDLARMTTLLSSARHSSTAVTLSIPRPDGGYSEFLLVDSRVMPGALQDKYPEHRQPRRQRCGWAQGARRHFPARLPGDGVRSRRRLGRASRALRLRRSLSQLPPRRSRRCRARDSSATCTAMRSILRAATCSRSRHR